MQEHIIEVEQLSKKFGQKTVLKDISLKINKGDSIAFLGHNGSGKSTFLKLISGLMNPSSGKIIYTSHLKFQYIPEHFPKMNLTVREYVTHMGLIEGMKRDHLEKRMEELFQNFYMDSMIDIPLKHLSKGTLQKVGVIQALLLKPDVILLDEPLSGQDIMSQNQFIALIKKWNNEGVTVLMSCHQLFLVHQIANRIYELKNGSFEEKDKHDIFINHINTARTTSKLSNLDSALVKSNDILIFEKGGKEFRLPDLVNKYVVKMEILEEFLLLTVPMELSNDVILTMIQNNYKLREMKHE